MNMLVTARSCLAGLISISAALLLAGCSGDTSSSAGATIAALSARDGSTPDEIIPDGPPKIKNPTIADLAVAGPLGDRTLGSVNAPLTVIEYASTTCPYCRVFHQTTFPQFKREYIDTGKVRFILREFPIGRSSGNAWLATRCAPEDKFFKLFELYLKDQKFWVSQTVRPDAIYRVAKKVGMSRATFDSCLANQKIVDAIKWVKQRGRQLGVSGTPTFFIGEKKVRSALTIEEIRALTDTQLRQLVATSG